MRSRPYLPTLLFVLLPVLVFSQVNLNNGLVAYYPFNGNANDASGNGNNPIFNNATLTSDFYGNVNSAYHFNGTDNYMQIPNSSTLNFSDNKMSLCAWVRPTGFYEGLCYNNILISKETANYIPGNYSLRFADAITGCSSNPSTTHEVFYGPDGGLGDQNAIELNKWYNVVFTSDGIRAKLYVNCQLVVDEPVSQSGYTNPYDLFLGHLNDGTYPYWLNGDLDEVRIYNRALNEDEVHAYSVTCTTNADVVAGFTGPDTACANTSVQFNNTSTGASNYYWSFCAAGFNTTPVADNLGNPGNFLSTPVFMDYALDDNGNYYGFVSNYVTGHIIRLDYGPSLCVSYYNFKQYDYNCLPILFLL